ncbi:hypothetical protein [Methanosarcina sp. MSH10X1]|uniref:hypothetical protein n=1 Tax=Methanosarcina sp. MSH10X1 TaxID=2507075 RepID=UPI0013E37FFA|nr:hypothetical protein [Methanosarcina sp. MSH10X1]
MLFIVVEDVEELIREFVYKSTPCISGSPGDRQTLMKAGIEKPGSLLQISRMKEMQILF